MLFIFLSKIGLVLYRHIVSSNVRESNTDNQGSHISDRKSNPVLSLLVFAMGANC